MHTVGITGHQYLPDQAIGFVKDGIADVLHRFHGAFVGISSLAIGTDQLFAEAVLQVNGQLHAVIPCHGYEATFADDATLQAFRRLLESAEIVETLAYDHPSEDAFLAAGYRVVELSDILIAVWDGLEAKGKGGTADVVRYARGHQKELFVIWPPGVKR
jgi:hypothetical protein